MDPAPLLPVPPSLPLSRRVASRLVWVPQAGSTNVDLVRLAAKEGASEWPHLAVLATDTQTAGRGRLGRVWTAPAGSSLAASVLVRPRVPVGSLGWLPLIAGLAMSEALRSLGADAALKWPNDVRIGGRKVCGILSELLPDLSGAVIGSGVNLAVEEQDLPVDTATSLLVEGIDAALDSVLSAYLVRLSALVVRFEAAGGDAEVSGLRRDVEARCESVGRSVRVLLPDGEQVVGRAAAIDVDGRLVVERDGHPRLVVAAGEVTHLRY